MPKAYTAQEIYDSFVPCEDDGNVDGIYCYKDGKLFRSTLEFYHIDSLGSYFKVNFQVLNDDFYNLPGYTITDNIHTGTNVVIKDNCSLTGPLVLGDNTFIETNASINTAIIGERALVDKGCIVEHSIIFDRTYTAGNLEIKNKIITPGRIIDPYTGGVLERNSFSYAFSPVQNRSAWILRLWEHFIALVLATVLFVPYLLLLPFYLTHKKSHWCWKLSMDRYPGYWAVLFFRKELVKSHPANEHFVFQMGESYGLQNTPEQRRIYDYYYHYHCSCVLVLKVVLRSLGKRGFATYVERKRS
jgi:acetyltransferase-like isoleucine patch superfamily enzyme